MKKIFTFLVLLKTFTFVHAQFIIDQNPFEPTTANDRVKSFAQHKKLTELSLVKNIPFRSIGPWIQSGRVSDIAVDERDPTHFYVAYATGGLFKTVSNGTSFEPLFDNQPVITLGHVAANFEKNIIWAGSGEQNSSRSSYAGDGVYKSTDGGKTFTNMGLAETHHTSRIVLHPTDDNIVWVAALGHLYSPNKERGVYKTSDGGKTWKQTLFVDENTGAVDIVIDKNNPQILYVSTWNKTRRAWNFYGNGKGSGIYKSIDGGDTWNLISDEKSGFPQGIGNGRIGLSLGYTKDSVTNNSKSILFTVLDNQNPKPNKEIKNARKKKSEITKESLKKMSDKDFIKLDKSEITGFLEDNNFPEKYKAEDIIEQIKSGKISTQTLYEYIDKDDDGLTNTNIYQAEVYRYEDSKFVKTHTDDLDGIFSTYGYYFAQIRVDPSDINKLYVIGTRLIKSYDGGKTWKSITKDNVHLDGHALWINPNRTGHIIYGNDGGLNISYDDGTTWTKLNSLPLAQFYHVTVDMKEPYNVYGGIQDNGVWFGSSKTKPNNAWQASGVSEFKTIMGGDGMQTQVDTRDNVTVYTGFQFGETFRLRTDATTRASTKYIKPKHDLGEKPLRFNWQTPILLSKFNQDILYYGANRLYRSLDKGDNWEAISPDLTNGAKKIQTDDKKMQTGNVPYGTLTCIHESPLKFGLIYVGTDDGNIQITQDGGTSWKKISDKLPREVIQNQLYVSRVQASAFDKATVYAALNGYRWDNFDSDLYVSKNYGETWERVGTNLPNAEPINVVKEDPKNENILYVGTDNGLYVSFDKGKTFSGFAGTLPNVPVHDVVIHPRDNEIVVATHGRSIYIASVTELQQLTPENLKKSLMAFDIKKIKQSNWGRNFDKWEPKEDVKLELPLYTNTAGKVRVSIKAGKDLVLNEFTTNVAVGINYPEYDLTFDEKNLSRYQNYLNDNSKEVNKDNSKQKIELKKAENEKFYLQRGKYTVVYDKDGETTSKELIIE